MNCNRGLMPLLKGSYLERSLHLCASLVLAALLTASPSTSSAAIVFSDDFSAPDGGLAGTTPDTGSTNWTPTAAAATPIQIASGAAAVKSAGQDEYAGLTVPVLTSGGFISTSLDVNVSAAQAAGDYFSHLSNPLGTTSLFYQRLFARSATGGYQLGLLDTSGTGSATTWGTTVLSLGTTYDVDVTWTFVPGPTNDTFALLVNGLPYLTHAWTSVLAEPAALAAVNLRQGSAGSAPTLTVDNLVVTAIPEPTSLVLGGMFGLLGVARRKRRGLE